MKAIASLTAFIILASECELTLANLAIKVASLAIIAGVAYLTTREPRNIPKRRMQ